jgi:hypothetical protein
MTNFLEQNTSPRITSLVSTIAMLALLPLLLMGLYQAYSVLTQALGTPANITVNTKIVLEPLRTEYIHAFAQGGEEQADMIHPVINEVRALRPKYIRIDHIYDSFDVVSGSGQTISFNWSKLDAYVNSLLETGAKPVLALSYMPPSIAQNGSVINPPTSWNDWATVVQKTIEHYSGKGNRNLSGVYYEVWNEPDLPQFGNWKLSGEKNFLTLYHQAAFGASNAQNCNQFFLGGPATSGLYKTWIQALVSSGERIDFLSWHSYLSDPKQYATDQRNLAQWLAATPQFALLPKLITESGLTGNKSAAYGTMYAAAHTAAVFRNTVTGGPTYLFSFQLKDGPGQQKDGWGILPHESTGEQPKPRYYVYNFLDTMAGNRLELTGEGSWVSGLASIQNNIIHVLLVNFNNQKNKSENVPITLKNLEPGIYSYRERLLLNRDAKFTETVGEDGKLTREVYMPENSVAILEITRKEATPSAQPTP